MEPSPAAPFSSYQRFVIAVLAFLQFTVILDFMLLSPLGAVVMPALSIGPKEFSRVVSAYAFSAGASGFLIAGLADRFDRKKFLLLFYAGFVAATAYCGWARDYRELLFARTLTGVFGGVIGSIVFAIVTDLFAFSVRGRVMGVVQAAFAASQVLGLPIGLYLSNHFSWHAPFFMVAGVALLVGVVIVVVLKPIDGHLKAPRQAGALQHLLRTVSRPRYLLGFASTALLATGGFMLMPFGSAFSVNNLGISLDQLPLVYGVTGLCSGIVGPLLGRVADRIGKFRLFCAGSTVAVVMVLIYTRLSLTPLGAVIALSVVLFASISARMISASALVSAIPSPPDRGAYMAISASLQQISGGLGAALAGAIVVQQASGHLLRYEWLGYVVTTTTLLSIGMMFLVDRMVRAPAPATATPARAPEVAAS
jgi:predicted MFS family arabinose efflux permease